MKCSYITNFCDCIHFQAVPVFYDLRTMVVLCTLCTYKAHIHHRKYALAINPPDFFRHVIGQDIDVWKRGRLLFSRGPSINYVVSVGEPKRWFTNGQKENLEAFIWTKNRPEIFLYFGPRSLKWTKSKKEYNILNYYFLSWDNT